MEMDEAGKQGDDFVTGEVRTTDYLVQCLSALYGVEQLADSVIVGHDGSFGLLGLPPKGEMHRRGHDVLIVDADIGKHLSCLIHSTNRAFVGWWHSGNDNGTSVSMDRVEFNAWLWLAVFVCGLMHHEDFLFGTDAREMAVVSDTYEQTASVGIGKCRHGFGQLACIRHTIFEILLLMLAFVDEALKIAFVVHLDAKIV